MDAEQAGCPVPKVIIAVGRAAEGGDVQHQLRQCSDAVELWKALAAVHSHWEKAARGKRRRR